MARTLLKLCVAGACSALLTLGFVAPTAQADDAVCPSSLGQAPTLTSVTVGGTAISLTPNPGKGKLYASLISKDLSTKQGESLSCSFTVRVNRDYGNVFPDSAWRSMLGGPAWFLNHGEYAIAYAGAGSYTDAEPITDATPVVATVTMPTSGGFSPEYYFSLKSQSRLDGTSPVVLSGNTLTVTGLPSQSVKLVQQWPNGIAADFNPLIHDAAWYTSQNINVMNWNGGAQRGYDIRTGMTEGGGGPNAHNFEVGLAYEFGIEFSKQPAGGETKGTEEHRGEWFEADNTPQWQINFDNSSGSPQLKVDVGNVHEYLKGVEQTVTLNEGSLRFFLPDAWTSLAFGVDSTTAPEIIQGAIQVTRTEDGSTNLISATTTPATGGIVVDCGTVTYSSPQYLTKANTAMKGKKKGKNVQLSITVPAGSSGKMGVYAVNKGTKGKKVATVKVKKLTKAKAYKVTVKKAKQGFYAKVGSTVIGSLAN